MANRSSDAGPSVPDVEEEVPLSTEDSSAVDEKALAGDMEVELFPLGDVPDEAVDYGATLIYIQAPAKDTKGH